ncbi:MAG: SufE family protein [Flavobacteriales bacterium]|jgi:cysteine desulfuration protein SufE|tara:strand:- start:1232 stop:1645 length:414 start_codon:yes stop_codon:yes gene_type:complete
MTIQEIQLEIIDEFDMFDDWMQKYDYLIELSKDLPAIKEDLKVDDNLIKGCQSKVWLHASKNGDKVSFTADSDAIITKGIVALLVRVFDDQKAQDILENELHFIDAIGLKEHLSMTRSNGLVSMIKQMKFYAIAFSS